MFNVATCAAIYDAVYEGMPLVRRAVTVTGNAVARPSNFLAPIGTPFSDLIEAAGGFSVTPQKILCGGPMMGIAQHTTDAATIKGCNALTCLTEHKETAVPHCIRCGKCLTVCPMKLQPLHLFEQAEQRSVEGLKHYYLMDCIECGCCSYECPGKVPLTARFKEAKQLVREAGK